MHTFNEQKVKISHFQACVFIHTYNRIWSNNRKLKVFMHSYMHSHKHVDQNSPKLNSPKIKGPLDTRPEVKIRWSSRYKIPASCCLVWPVGSRSTLCLEWYPLGTRSTSSVKICDPLDTRSQSHDFFSKDPLDARSKVKIWWSSRYKIPVSCCLVWPAGSQLTLCSERYPLDTRSRSPVKICSSLVLRRSRLRFHFCCRNQWSVTLSSSYKVKVSTMIRCITLSSSGGQVYDVIFSPQFWKYFHFERNQLFITLLIFYYNNLKNFNFQSYSIKSK